MKNFIIKNRDSLTPLELLVKYKGNKEEVLDLVIKTEIYNTIYPIDKLIKFKENLTILHLREEFITSIDSVFIRVAKEYLALLNETTKSTQNEILAKLKSLDLDVEHTSELEEELNDINNNPVLRERLVQVTDSLKEKMTNVDVTSSTISKNYITDINKLYSDMNIVMDNITTLLEVNSLDKEYLNSLTEHRNDLSDKIKNLNNKGVTSFNDITSILNCLEIRFNDLHNLSKSIEKIESNDFIDLSKILTVLMVKDINEVNDNDVELLNNYITVSNLEKDTYNNLCTLLNNDIGVYNSIYSIYSEIINRTIV